MASGKAPLNQAVLAPNDLARNVRPVSYPVLVRIHKLRQPDTV
jgi:hypothetical protein